MDLSFSGDIVQPGDPVSITTVTEPNSVVLVSVVDKSLTLLAEACKSLEKDNVSQSSLIVSVYSRPRMVTSLIRNSSVWAEPDCPLSLYSEKCT